MSKPNLNTADDASTKVTAETPSKSVQTTTSQNTDDAPTKTTENTPLKSRSASEEDPISTPGFILVALTTTLICWLITGIIGFKSPTATVQDDQTLIAVVLWIFQFISSICLVIAAVSKGWSTPAATTSASIVGLGVALVYGVCYAEWGNAATWMFWVAAGVYGALGVEARMGWVEGLERGIARAMEGKGVVKGD